LQVSGFNIRLDYNNDKQFKEAHSFKVENADIDRGQNSFADSLQNNGAENSNLNLAGQGRQLIIKRNKNDEVPSSSLKNVINKAARVITCELTSEPHSTRDKLMRSSMSLRKIDRGEEVANKTAQMKSHKAKSGKDTIPHKIQIVATLNKAKVLKD
jgi:hypothetical protein